MVMALNIDVVRCRKFYGEFLCVRIRDSVHVAQCERSGDRCPSRLRHRAVAPPGLHRTGFRVAIQLKTFCITEVSAFLFAILLSQFFQSYFVYGQLCHIHVVLRYYKNYVIVVGSLSIFGNRFITDY